MQLSGKRFITAQEATGSKRSAQEQQSLREIKADIDPSDDYLGDSMAMLKVYEQISRLNDSFPNDHILIRGETGVGKTKIAQLIHKSSKRSGCECLRENVVASKSSDAAIMKGRLLGYGKEIDN